MNRSQNCRGRGRDCRVEGSGGKEEGGKWEGFDTGPLSLLRLLFPQGNQTTGPIDQLNGRGSDQKNYRANFLSSRAHR